MSCRIDEAYSRETFVYFDVETIPCQDASYLDKLCEEIKAPAQYKKPESIEKWLAENRETAALEAMAKTSFDGGRGHVCTIAWAINDGPTDVARTLENLDYEAEALHNFFDALKGYHSLTLVGHNVAGFDIGFLRKRAICLGVKLPPAWAFPRDPKPWDKGIIDTMHAWAGARDTISLDELCGILNIPGKDGFDGSMVAEAWANGEHDKISAYCRDDVERVRKIHQKFLEAGW